MKAFALVLAASVSFGFSTAGALAQAPASQTAPAAVATVLQDGETLEIHGRMRMEPGGRLHHVMVHTPTPYKVGRKTLRAIEMFSYNDYALLYAHKDEVVTAKGKVVTESVSPYYKNGLGLKLTSLTLLDGTDLLGAQKDAVVAPDTGIYKGEATLPADLAAPWTYQIDGKPDTRGLLHCSSNGGGDVVNCTCANGYKASGASAVSEGKTKPGDLLNPMAQFGVGDEAKAVTLSVTCARY